ncbi:MAG: sensor histidine kinase [Oscillospiraceae bacterium]
MKPRPIKLCLIALMMACIYVLGLVVGVFVICYIPGSRNREQFWKLENQLAAQYIENGGMSRASTMGGVALLAYDSKGVLLDQTVYTSRVFQNFISEARQNDLKEILEGKNTFRLVLLAEDRTVGLGYTSLAYVGVPLVTDGKITGAMVWVVELRDLPDTIVGYICVFTAIFAMAAGFTFLSLRNQRRYERMRRNYTDNITHALKSPIASIKALTEALSDGMEKSPADRNVYYGMIIREANRQERMIHDVLELSKLQSYCVDCPRKIVDAADVFAPVFEKYASLCDLMGIDFLVSEEFEHLPRLYTHAASVQQILETLFDNALKYVPENGTICVSVTKSRRRITVCIADNGKGISAKDLPHIFERFYRANRNDNESGNGLGLAIAKELASNLNEKVWLRSEENVGTEAFLTVSLKKWKYFREQC